MLKFIELLNTEMANPGLAKSKVFIVPLPLELLYNLQINFAYPECAVW